MRKPRHSGRTPNTTDAVTLYKAAIELDPDFAMAHAALGRAYTSYIYYQTDLGRKEYETAFALRRGSRIEKG